MSNLNDRQFFHGTTARIQDGMVRPVNDVPGKHVSEYSMGDPGDMSEGDHAFVTEDENYAWHAATTFHPSQRRARVYETGPAEDMKPGPWHRDHPDFLAHHEVDDPDHYHISPDDEDYPLHLANVEVAEDTRKNKHQPEYGSPTGFPIKRRIDIMPGRQGTIPQVNWGVYGERQYDQSANHPTDEQVRYGTRGRDEVHARAIKENQAVTEFREPPRKRTGAALRAFMRGEPEPPHDPHAGQGKLF